MQKIEVTIDENPSEDNDKILREGIVDFNATHLHDKAVKFSVYALHETQIIGGAIVWAHKDAYYIDTLWVNRDFRANGVGSEIIAKIESRAQKHHIRKIFVDTFEFQAFDFYERFQFKEIGRAPGYLLGYDRIFLKKKLHAI